MADKEFQNFKGLTRNSNFFWPNKEFAPMATSNKYGT
jgi:hypothetical protein